MFNDAVTVHSEQDSICVSGAPLGLNGSNANFEVCLNTKNDDINDSSCGDVCKFYQWTDYFDITIGSYLGWTIIFLWLKFELEYFTGNKIKEFELRPNEISHYSKRRNLLRRILTIVDIILQFGVVVMASIYLYQLSSARDTNGHDDKTRFAGYNNDATCHNNGLQFVWKAHVKAHEENDDFLDDPRSVFVEGCVITILSSAVVSFVAGIVETFTKPAASTGDGKAANNDDANNSSTYVGSLAF
jgi:hypothetical protein